MTKRDAPPYTFSKDAVLGYFSRGEFDRALALLHGERAPGCAVMRARCFGRQQLMDNALADRVVRECEHGLGYSQHWRERAELSIMRAAYDNNEPEVRESIQAGLTQSMQRRDVLFEAQCRWVKGELDAVGATGVDALGTLFQTLDKAERDSKATNSDAWWWLELNLIRARGLHTAAAISSAHGQADEEQQFLIRSVLAAKLCRFRDLTTEALGITNLAFFARHFPSVNVRELILLHVTENEGAALTTTYARGYAQRALMVNRFLFGTTPEPLFRESETATLQERVFMLADRLLYGAADDTAAVKSIVTELRDLVGRSGWLLGMSEWDHILLVSAALAPHDLERSRQLTFKPRVEHNLIGQLRPRVEQHYRRPPVSLALGIQAKAANDLGVAATHLSESLLHSRGYDLLGAAAIAGIELFTISRNPDDLIEVHKVIERFPLSATSARLRSALAKSADCAPGDFPYLRPWR